MLYSQLSCTGRRTEKHHCLGEEVKIGNGVMSNMEFLSPVPPEGCIELSSHLTCQSLLIKRISDQIFDHCISNLKLNY